MKVFIVGGGGLLGSTTAFCIAEKGLADEIVLYDAAPGLAEHHAFDLTEAMCMISPTRIRAGGWADIKGSDIVISAAGLELDKHSQDDVQNASLLMSLLKALAAGLRDLAPDAVVITMTNPVDIFSYLLHKMSGLPRRRFLGYNLNDTIRMRAGLAEHFGADTRDVRAFAVGEHGRTKVQLYSSVEIRGEKKSVSPEEIAEMHEELGKKWQDFLGLGIKRTAGWTSAVGAALMVQAIVSGDGGALPCSCVPDGEYGFSDVSLGLPVRLGRGGVEEIIRLEMTRDEREALAASAEYLQDVIASVKAAYPSLY